MQLTITCAGCTHTHTHTDVFLHARIHKNVPNKTDGTGRYKFLGIFLPLISMQGNQCNKHYRTEKELTPNWRPDAYGRLLQPVANVRVSCPDTHSRPVTRCRKPHCFVHNLNYYYCVLTPNYPLRWVAQRYYTLPNMCERARVTRNKISGEAVMLSYIICSQILKSIVISAEQDFLCCLLCNFCVVFEFKKLD